jgi:hypothetical protein
MLGDIYQCNQGVVLLERLIHQSDARRGWRQDPETVVENLMKKLATLGEPEASISLEQLQVLKEKMRDLTSLY